MGNVMKVSDGNSWFLIDFMDAAPSPQDAATGDHLNPYNHAPEIVDRSFKHTTAVDIWYLIDTAGVEEYGEKCIQEQAGDRGSVQTTNRKCCSCAAQRTRAQAEDSDHYST
ncbi:hypothetical protein PI124_g19631 [Phytophthora idaei]|nr:hypothetical protein PI125_g20743 [Phytophthora idaei]KAG3139987.1 hypothetical protein PI126_g16224 [Phytophthora idaei]KAG3235336.1 hypothetical protein PI124_g19631 [Phytophthora idaei]